MDTKEVHPFDLRVIWIWKDLVQLGINVRQSGNSAGMRYYLELLREEIAMTERFLRGDEPIPQRPLRPVRD